MFLSVQYPGCSGGERKSLKPEGEGGGMGSVRRRVAYSCIFYKYTVTECDLMGREASVKENRFYNLFCKIKGKRYFF